MARKLPNPEEYAAGQHRPSVAELMASIHMVNPTDKGLDAAEQQRRYALKALLQSRLIRDWSGHLDFEMSDDDGEVITIRHRGHQRDGAHAMLGALDADARYIVYTALHWSAEPASRPAPESGPDQAGAPGGMLRRGREALAAWNYDEARACFEAAWTASPSEASAYALLDLLVEHLALDADALALKVPDSVLSSRVARLLAIAAARAGDARGASSLIRRLDAAAELDVRLVLTDLALRGNDEAALRAHRGALRDLAPTHPIQQKVDAALAAIDGARHAPLERALAEAVASGDPLAITGAADALLRVAPGSALATQALGAIEARRRKEEAARHVAFANAHERALRFDLALDELAHARQLGLDVRTDTDRVRKQQAAASDEAAISAALVAFDHGDPAPYTNLSLQQRDALRGRRHDRRLDRLEETLRARLRDPVGCFHAMESAEAAIRDGAAHIAFATLEAADLLSAAPARDLVRLAREGHETKLRRDALDLVAKTEACMQAGNDAEAMRIGQALHLDHLPAAERPRAHALLETLRERIDDAERVAEFDWMMRQCAFFEAQRIAIKRCQTHPTLAWQRRLEAIETRLKQIFASCILAPWRDGLSDLTPPFVQLSADACLEPDGKHAWLASAVAHFVFLRRIEVATSRWVGTTLIRTLEPLTRPRVALLGRRLVLAATGGRVFACDLADDHSVQGVVTTAAGMDPYVKRPEYIDPGRHPDLRVVVRDVVDGHLAPVFYVWNGQVAGGEIRQFRGTLSLFPLRLPGLGPRLLIHEATGLVSLEDGWGQGKSGAGYALRIDSATVRPGGGGVVAVGAFPPGQATDSAIAVLEAGVVQATLRRSVPGTRMGLTTVACSHATGLLFLVANAGTENPSLSAYDAGLRPLWTLHSRGIVHLLVDAEDNHAVLVFATRSGVRLAPLGPVAPDVPADVVSSAVYPTPTEGMAPDAPTGAAGVLKALAPAKLDDLSDDPELVALIAVSDLADAPEARFRALDDHAVWRMPELQTRARIAQAAMDWKDGPWGQRLHAIAAFAEAKMRQAQHANIANLTQVPGAWSVEALTAVLERATAWLETAADDMGMVRVSQKDPKWDGSAGW